MIDTLLLLDFYGQLLTERTRSLAILYFEEDMTFSEIAELEGISRQAVHDTVGRGVRSLKKYEEKLGLVGRFLEEKKMVRDALASIRAGESENAICILSRLTEKIDE